MNLIFPLPTYSEVVNEKISEAYDLQLCRDNLKFSTNLFQFLKFILFIKCLCHTSPLQVDSGQNNLYKQVKNS